MAKVKPNQETLFKIKHSNLCCFLKTVVSVVLLTWCGKAVSNRYLRFKRSSQSLDLSGMFLFVTQLLSKASGICHRSFGIVFSHLQLICLVLDIRLTTLPAKLHTHWHSHWAGSHPHATRKLQEPIFFPESYCYTSRIMLPSRSLSNTQLFPQSKNTNKYS